MKLILLTLVLVGCTSKAVIVKTIESEAIQAVETEVVEHLRAELKDVAEKELLNHFPATSESVE